MSRVRVEGPARRRSRTGSVLRSATRTWTAGVVALAGALAIPAGAAAATATGAAEPPHVPIWDNGPGGERYVSMGDSFASGPGIDPMRAECMRSERNFPTLVATGLDAQAFTDASCGGAKLADLWQPQALGDFTNAPQLDALDPSTTLVTLGTIGGNDVELVQLAAGCLQSPDCVDSSPDNPFLERIEGTRAPLARAIREVKERAPKALVVVVGYSIYLPYDGCEALSSLVTPAESGYFQGMVDRLSDAMEETAAAEGAVFADLRDIPGALDHTACAPQDEQWIRALGVPGDGVNFHPSSAGMAQMAWRVESAVRQERGLPPVPQPGTVAAPTPTPTPTPTPVTTPTPGATPTPGETRAEVRAELRAALKDTRLTARCGWSADEHRQRTVRMRLRGGHGLVKKVEFRLGTRRVASQWKAPFVTERRASRLRAIGEPVDWRRHRKMRAKVRVRAGGEVMHRTVSVRRPRCLR